jgi:CRP-like cAMP-binding protein
MSVPPNELKREYQRGEEIPLSDLVNRYGVPREELVSFQQSIRYYPAGKVMFQEGDSDKTVFLLRYGAVGIYKKVDATQERIATIEAVNFVGEMGMINNEPRSATVITQSEGALVYALGKTNLSLISANPKWSELMIKGLSHNLAQTTTQMVTLMSANRAQRAEIERLRAENDQTMKKVALIFSAILNFESIITDQAMIGSKGWTYLETLSNVTKALITYYIPSLKIFKEAAEKKAMRDCLDAVRTSGTGSVYTELTKFL